MDLYCITAYVGEVQFFVTTKMTLSRFQADAATFTEPASTLTFGELFIYSPDFPDDVSSVRIHSFAPGASAAPQQSSLEHQGPVL